MTDKDTYDPVRLRVGGSERHRRPCCAISSYNREAAKLEFRIKQIKNGQYAYRGKL